MLRLTIALLMAISFLFSCQKDKEAVPAVTSAVPLSSSATVRIKGHEEFFNLIDKIGNMSEQQKDEWENSNGFISYRTTLKKARVEWDSL